MFLHAAACLHHSVSEVAAGCECLDPQNSWTLQTMVDWTAWRLPEKLHQALPGLARREKQHLRRSSHYGVVLVNSFLCSLVDLSAMTVVLWPLLCQCPRSAQIRPWHLDWGQQLQLSRFLPVLDLLAKGETLRASGRLWMSGGHGATFRCYAEHFF